MSRLPWQRCSRSSTRLRPQDLGHAVDSPSLPSRSPVWGSAASRPPARGFFSSVRCRSWTTSRRRPHPATRRRRQRYGRRQRATVGDDGRTTDQTPSTVDGPAPPGRTSVPVERPDCAGGQGDAVSGAAQGTVPDGPTEATSSPVSRRAARQRGRSSRRAATPPARAATTRAEAHRHGASGSVEPARRPRPAGEQPRQRQRVGRPAGRTPARRRATLASRRQGGRARVAGPGGGGAGSATHRRTPARPPATPATATATATATARRSRPAPLRAGRPLASWTCRGPTNPMRAPIRRRRHRRVPPCSVSATGSSPTSR